MALNRFRFTNRWNSLSLWQNAGPACILVHGFLELLILLCDMIMSCGIGEVVWFWNTTGSFSLFSAFCWQTVWCSHASAESMANLGHSCSSVSHFACEGGSSGLLEHTDSHWDVSQTPPASKPPGSKPVCSVTVSIACTCVAGKVILKTKVSLVCKGRLCNYLLQALKNSNWKGSTQVRRAK